MGMETTTKTQTKCDERIYTGSQYDRLVGRDCSRMATVTLHSTSGGQERHVCEQHARRLIRQSGYQR